LRKRSWKTREREREREHEEKRGGKTRNLSQRTGQVAPGKVEAGDRVRQRVPLVDRHRVGDAVARVENDTGGAARGVEREHGLDGDVPREEIFFS